MASEVALADSTTELVILDPVDGSERQDFIKGIRQLGEDIKFTVDSVERIYGILIREDTYFNGPHNFPLQAEKWKVETEKYKAQIRLLKGTVEKVKVNAIHPFVALWAPMVLEGDPDEDEDVLIEFKSFSEKLAAIKPPAVELDDMLDAVTLLMQDCDSKRTHGQGYNGEIQTLREDINALERKRQAASHTIEKLVPSFVKDYGLGDHYDKLVWLLMYGLRGLGRGLNDFVSVGSSDSKKDGEGAKKKCGKNDKNGNSTDVGGRILKSLRSSAAACTGEVPSLWSAVDTVEGCEEKIRECCQKLNELEYRQGNSNSDVARWDVCTSRTLRLEITVDRIAPQLESIAKMAESVKGEVDSYVAFLSSPDCKNDVKRQQALAEIEFAGGIYQSLDCALEDFVTR
ncbi:hypothetical protein DFH07DRAFT_221651 [Mycena maculata]|uniref:Uncharacterized protein n=1 Tax=Mycena maculata TaxID=230809 RepID=A0AAD7HVQ7_9AGAR|nr:hypothetical protein DFH07DRAFT_221651 [Mycena maculata]